MSFVSMLPTLASALSQAATNGLSTFGTLSAPTLPNFLANSPLPNGFPWGTATANNTNPYTNSPFTGVTRNYDFTVTRGNIAPDGVNKSVILVNGAFPGPLIEANWGDQISVTVHNQLDNPAEGTSLHWHGFLQHQTPYYDGVPGITQCPISPGKSFTYNIKAELFGTSWWHSHYSAQYSGGIAGPLIVYGPDILGYDIDIGPVMLSDWYHTPEHQIVEELLTPTSPGIVFSDNNLINGKMNFDCSKVPAGTTCTPNAGISKFKFQTGKTHRLRLINMGSEATQQFSIDGHSMTVISNDFVPLRPYTTDVVTLGIGQRADVIVKATGKANGAYWMRSNATCGLASQPYALAAIYYPQADTNSKPTSVSTVTAPPCTNEALSKTVPFFNFGPVPSPSATQQLDITFAKNGSGIPLFYVNNSTFRVDYNDPLLLEAKLGNRTFPPNWNVYNFGSNSSVRLIVRNFIPAEHPMHLHGHNFHVLNFGTGNWDGTIVNSFNPDRRDVALLPAAASATVPGFLVIQFEQDNPGAWPFHCHIAWHVSQGLYVSILERPNDITEAALPSVMAQTCRDWASWTGTHIPDMIDSGL